MPPTSTIKPMPEMREFGDTDKTRRFIYDDVLSSMQSLPELANDKYALRLKDPTYIDPETHPLKDQKHAILSGRTLGRRIQGTWELTDAKTGQTVDSRKQVIARVPFMTQRGTFIHNGNEYTVNHQQRLLPGVYTRLKETGELESHANILPGKGPAHRYMLDPKRGIFQIKIGQAVMPLMPLLQAMGTTAEEFRDAWGNDLHAANYKENNSAALKKLQERVLKQTDLASDEGSRRQKLVQAFERMELDPDVSRKTLGKPHKGLNKEAILDITKRLLAVHRGEADVDDRDHLAYQRVLGPEDLFAERIAKDHGRLRSSLLYKATRKGNLSAVPPGALTPQLEQLILGSGLAGVVEEINTAELLDKQSRITRLGEGGIGGGLDAVPDEARSVQSSHLGFVDAVRTPESLRVGVDLQMASGARKGRDGQIYTAMLDPRTGQPAWVTPKELAEKVVTFPGTLSSGKKRVPVIRDGRLVYAKRHDVDYVLPNFENAFSHLGNLVPMKSMLKPQRAAMAGRMLTQALPLSKPEAPLVQGALPDAPDSSFEEEYGRHLGAVKADKPGTVTSVADGVITLRQQDGTQKQIELHQNAPFNRKTFLHQTSVVRPGDQVQPGQLLARSNYTDEHGALGLGLNARTAYTSWGGANFEDAIVVSKGFADRAKSEHMYQYDLDQGEHTKVGKDSFVGLFPQKFDKRTLETIGPDGVVKSGTAVQYGQPLILAVQQRAHAENRAHKKGQAGFHDNAVLWEHHDPGVVTDVVQGKSGPVVVVKSASTLQVGDKLSGKYGDKGVVAQVLPDGQMPHDGEGRPFEVLMNPLGTISRGNPSQMAELMLGKLAAKLGRPIKVKDFGDTRDMIADVDAILKKHGMSDLEDIVDPATNAKIPGIATGMRWLMKLHHTSESKEQARSGGSYSAEDLPAKGGPSGSKRISMLDVNALLSHGAIANLKDAASLRGRRNDDYWLQFMQGYTPREPDVPTVYTKFISQLKAAGINAVRRGDQTHVMALTDKDVDVLAGDRGLSSGDTVRFDKGLEPVAGGLFDKALTGGHGGTRWSSYKLSEPMPNPVMADPVRHILGLTEKQFEAVIAGQHTLDRYGTGPKAIAEALKNVSVPKELALARTQIASGKKTLRDSAVRRLGYLKSAQKLGLHPGDWVLNKVPVLPPAFRPVSMMDSGTPLVSDANYLYKELFDADRNLKEMKEKVGEENIGPERSAVYHAFKAVTGLGEPVTTKSREKKIKGLLQSVFGSNPKFSSIQRRLLSTTVDNVGRAVITPNPDFDMDTVGLPEDKAFSVYAKFMVRRLTRRGMPLAEAVRHVREKTDLARSTLLQEMDDRPVFINRAPVLHKFGIMAFRPQLVKGATLQVSPLVVRGFNADFDGDAMQYHVPSSDAAVREAYDRMLPSRNLLSPADFQTPVHAPTQEYVAGVFHASTAKSDRRPRVFRNRDDALKAYARGELQVGDPVEILEP